MTSYIKSKKFLLIYIFIEVLFSPILMACFSRSWLALMSIGIPLLLLPIILAAVFFDLFILDAIDKKDIVAEKKDNAFLKYLFITSCMLTYLVSIYSILFTKEPKIISLFMLCFLPMLFPRFVLTKDKLYSRLYAIDLDAIDKVTLKGHDQFQILTKEGASIAISYRGANELFEQIKALNQR